MRAVGISAAMLGKVWPIVEPWIASALKRADHSSEDVRAHIERGTMQLWLAWDPGRSAGAGKPVGCCVTELIESPRGRCCNVVVVAGSRFDEAYSAMEPDIIRWAASWGCVRLQMTGRKGWVRKLAGHGWRQIMVTLEKAVQGDG